ncbi:YvrJ family protein [Halalkalibacillus halophilus]|nr:YvrJ family protein [Halalkalibacillus halophilus]
MEMIQDIIGNFGFPIAITIYLLVRFEKKIAELTSAIATLKENINTKL